MFLSLDVFRLPAFDWMIRGQRLSGAGLAGLFDFFDGLNRVLNEGFVDGMIAVPGAVEGNYEMGEELLEIG